MTKPAPPKRPVEDDLPSINSNSDGEDSDDWNSAIADDDDLVTLDSALSDMDDELDSEHESSTRKPRVRPRDTDSDAEMPYETLPRKRRPSWDDDDGKKAIDRLPIKLSDGRIQKSGEHIVLQDEESEDEEEDIAGPSEPEHKRDDIATGARFGRASVIDVIQIKSRKARIQATKEQIADICQEIIGDPEDSVRTPHTIHLIHV